MNLIVAARQTCIGTSASSGGCGIGITIPKLSMITVRLSRSKGEGRLTGRHLLRHEDVGTDRGRQAGSLRAVVHARDIRLAPLSNFVALAFDLFAHLHQVSRRLTRIKGSLTGEKPCIWVIDPPAHPMMMVSGCTGCHKIESTLSSAGMR